MTRLLFTSGRGPAECRAALAGILGVFRREAEAAGLDADIAETSAPDDWGPPSAIAVLHGPGADGFVRSWTGSIQWIAQSPVRPHHKRKNWFIGVFALPPEPAVAGDLSAADVRYEAFRAGGPGGQHQNKTESAVRAVHLPSGLAVVARDDRSQHRNKALALKRLAGLIQSRQQLDALAAEQQAHAAHDSLERGKPIRRFKGAEFTPA
jgi:peptide chain release factor